jgi:phage terminase large subunit-like protein
MNKGPGLKEALERWKILVDKIQNMTTVDVTETPKQRQDRIKRLQGNFQEFVNYYFPHYTIDPKTDKIIPLAKFHIDSAKRVLKNPTIKEVNIWARGHAKSVTNAIFKPLWLKCQNKRQINTMLLISKSEDSAKQLLGDLQAELRYNQRYIADFGKQYNSGNWMDGNFTTTDGCFFLALGRGQSPRGIRKGARRPDYILIDDIDDDEMVRNPKRVNQTVDWIKEAVFGTFGADGGRFIMVGNLIAKNSVLAQISEIESVYKSQVNAYDSKGNPSWAEYWTKERLQEREDFMGYRSFQKEYMNNPITEGAIFKNDWIKYKKLPPLQKYDRLIAYCDPSFKSSTNNDYKAIKFWGTIDTELHCIDAFCRQTTITEMVRWFYDLHESLPKDVICYYYMEANFLQDLILDEFTAEGKLRGYQLPIIGDKRKKPDKHQRIEAISPLWERGFVFYNIDKENDPDMKVAIEQTLLFEKGSSTHDDSPDADEGAIFLLQQQKRVESFPLRFGYRPKPSSSW